MRLVVPFISEASAVTSVDLIAGYLECGLLKE